MFQTNKITNTVSSILGPKLTIDGDIHVDGDLLIYGEVNGNIECKGMVNSAKGSNVKGDIHAKSASVNGKVAGDLFVDNNVILDRGLHPILLGKNLITEIHDIALKYKHNCDVSRIECKSLWK